MLGPLSFLDESFNSSSFLEFKELTKELWELRDEAISNAFILQDILNLLQLVDEVLQESTWFQFLKGFGPCQDSETSAFAMINVLVHQIIEICQLRTRLHEQISKVFVRAQQNAADPSGHEIVIIEGDTDDINGNYAQNKETEKKLVKYEIKPKVSQSVLGVLLPSVGKKRRVPSSKGTLKVSVQQAPISESRGKKGVRSNFTTEQRDILKKWLFEHERDPFPNESQKQELCEKASISRQQLKTWFVNNRKRLLDGKQKHC